MPRPTALDAARSFRSALANDEAQAASRMATIYNRIFTGLQGDLAKLSVDIAAMEAPSRGAIMKLARMQAIQQQVKEQVTKFGGAVQNEVTIVQSQAVQAGIENALKLIETSLPPLPDDVRKQLVASFARLPADAVEAAAGLTGTDSPLNARLSDLYGEYVAEQVGSRITAGIAKGDNPRTIARQLEKNVLNGLGSGLTSALTTVRTAQIKSYQLANHATYMANDNIVKGWVWHAELGSACLGCTSLHGSVHPLEETLDGHHNCRCAPIPQTITYEELGLDIPETVEPTQTGEEWFNEQSAATQRELMGPAKYEAWKEGKFEFGQLSQKYNDPVYGDMLREASLKDLESGSSDKVKVSGQDFTGGYNETLKEIETIKQDGEFYEGELQEAQNKLAMEAEISAGLRDLGLSPARMLPEDWESAAAKFQNRAFDKLTYATEAQREAAGNLATGRRFLAPGERQIIQVGGQDVEKKWSGGTAAAAERATQRINEATKQDAQQYMAERLQEFGFDNAGDLSYEQQRRLLSKIAHGDEGDVTPQQRADALEIAYNPRAAQGMKLWEYYEVSMVKAGMEDQIQPPPDNRENFIPGYVTGKKKQKKVTSEEIDF